MNTILVVLVVVGALAGGMFVYRHKAEIPTPITPAPAVTGDQVAPGSVATDSPMPKPPVTPLTPSSVTPVKDGRTLYELNLGGSAVGNSINVSPKYIKALYIELSKLAKLNLRPGKNLMAMTSSTTDLLAFSHSLLAACVDLSKIANDLRLLSSGPQGGVGEISLPELQAGSSIMPGKVNPVLPEAVNQMYFLVSGNTVTIEHASQAAQLQLNVMLPVMTDRLIESIRLMNELIPQFAQSCVAGIKVNKKQCKENLERSTAYATLLSPKLGYDAVSSAVKEAVRKNKTIRQVVLEKKMVTNAEFDKLVSAFLGNNL